MSDSDEFHAKHSSGSNNSLLMVVGAVVLLGAAGGILYYVSRSPAPIPPAVPSTSATTSNTVTVTRPMELPPIDPATTTTEEAASTSVAPSTTSANNSGGNFAACPATCSGRETPELHSAIQNKLGLARHCYQTVINTNEMVAGSMVVRVRVGADGHVCDVSVINDTTGNGRLQNCVRTQFYGAYPKPTGACADIPVPLSFSSGH